jgi:hypothetical protein
MRGEREFRSLLLSEFLEAVVVPHARAIGTSSGSGACRVATTPAPESLAHTNTLLLLDPHNTGDAEQPHPS